MSSYHHIIKFKEDKKNMFYKDLTKRVNAYFKEKKISQYANLNMVFKTIFMLLLYLIPFTIIISNIESSGLTMLMWILMGFGMSGIGLSIMHDANHGSYSKNKIVNSLLGKLIWLVGGNDVNWKIQHNLLHHTYTNIKGMDEDIDKESLIRMSPKQKLLKWHKFQFIYVWFLYGMMTIIWATTKDYSQWRRYKKKNLIKTQETTSNNLLRTLIITKTLYFIFTLGLPLIFSCLLWWQTILCFLLMHFISGITLSLVFQLAHVVPTSSFETTDEHGDIKLSWSENQLMNTSNFAPNSKLFSWYIGGLNYQVEHHLFPNICHVHYNKISNIVKKTAHEYNLPYYSYDSFCSALREHAKMLYVLGKK